ncbi:MAG: sodium/solute symporter [Bacteroidota bacterium]
MLQTLDLSILVIYLLAILAVGFYFSKRAKSAEGFTVGSRSMSGFAVGFSILGTLLSSVSFIAYPGKAYASDWSAWVFSITLVIVAFVAVRVFLPFYRHLGVVSAYEFLDRRFGYWGRVYGSISFIMFSMGRMGIILYLLCLTLHHLLGWDLVTLIVLTGIITTVYTFVGGIEAVIWTDVAQVMVLFGGAIICLIVLLTSIPGGAGQVVEVAQGSNKMSLGSFQFDFVNSSFWMVFVFGITENLRNLGTDQTYVQRYISTKSDAEAAKSVWLGALTYAPLTLIFFIIGTSLYVFYQVFPNADVPELADSVFPFFIVQELPSGIRGLLIAALFAAAMSSLSSSINSVATVSIEDFVKRLSKAKHSERQVVTYLRVFTVVFGAIGILIGIAMISIKQALDVWWQLSGIFGGGILGLFLVGILSKKVDSRAAVPAVLLSVVTISFVTFSDAFNVNQKILAGFFGTMVLMLSAFLIARLLPKPKED